MADVCGWTFHKRTATPPNGGSYAMVHPYTEDELEPWPDYCHDRNALQEVYPLIRKANKVHAFLDIVIDFEDSCGYAAKGHGMVLLTSSCRIHVIAALKALDRWQPEWEIGEEDGPLRTD